MYQILLTAALYCFIYFGDRTGFSPRGKKYAVAILVVALMTSFSTTGYVALLILLCGMMIKKRTRLDRQILTMTLVTGIILGLEYFINGKNSLLHTFVISKLAAISDLQSSGGARLFVMRTPSKP